MIRGFDTRSHVLECYRHRRFVHESIAEAEQIACAGEREASLKRARVSGASEAALAHTEAAYQQEQAVARDESDSWSD